MPRLSAAVTQDIYCPNQPTTTAAVLKMITHDLPSQPIDDPRGINHLNGLLMTDPKFQTLGPIDLPTNVNSFQ